MTPTSRITLLPVHQSGSHMAQKVCDSSRPIELLESVSPDHLPDRCASEATAIADGIGSPEQGLYRRTHELRQNSNMLA
jgi:hypothetical protein